MEIEDLKLKKQEASKRYNSKSYEKHKTDKHTCPTCNGCYLYYNKSHHNQSKKHQFCLNLIKKHEENKLTIQE